MGAYPQRAARRGRKSIIGRSWSSRARRQRRHQRVVDVQDVRRHDLGGERIDQRRPAPQQSRQTQPDKVEVSRLTPSRGEDLCLVGEEAGASAAARNGMIGCRRREMVTQARHDSFSRICRTTLKRPGT